MSTDGSSIMTVWACVSPRIAPTSMRVATAPICRIGILMVVIAGASDAAIGCSSKTIWHGDVVGDADIPLAEGPEHPEGGHEVRDQERGRAFAGGRADDPRRGAISAFLGVIALHQPAVVERQPVARQPEQEAALAPDAGVGAERAGDVAGLRR